MTKIKPDQSIHDSDIKSGVADSVLAGMWRRIMRDYGIDEVRVDDLIFKYASLMTHLSPVKRLQFRGNLPSDLKKEAMTWRTFVRGLRVLRITKFEVILRLHHLNGMTEHRYVKEIGPPDKPEDDGEDEIDDDGVESEKDRTDLAVFFPEIMQSLGVSPSVFDKNLSNYMLRMRIPMTARNKTHVRGNLKKELLGKRLSWSSFIKGLNFLQVTKFDFDIILHFPKDKPSQHHRLIIINDREDLLEEIKMTDIPNQIKERTKVK